jgi:hypothetical protein
MLICGLTKSGFLIYRLMVARSKILWGDHVHSFHQFVGVLVIIVGVVLALGYI